MNFGPTGSATDSVRIRSISLLAAASKDQPPIAPTGINGSGCRAPQSAVIMP